MSLYIEKRGSGPELVLLHGWGLHGGLWGAFADELADRFSLSIVDLPGHGYSKIAGILTVDSMSQTIADSLKSNPARPATVLGWSMGALVALELANRHPDRFDRLIWIAGTPSFVRRADWNVGMQPETLAGFAEGLQQDYRATLKRFISLNSGQSGEREVLRLMQQRVFDRGEPSFDTLEQGLGILRDKDMRASLATSKQPLLLVQGAHDRLVHPHTVDAVKALRPAESLLLERAGHAPFLAEPDRVARAIREFVQ